MPRPQTATTRPIVAAGGRGRLQHRADARELLRLPQSWVKVKLENSPVDFGRANATEAPGGLTLAKEKSLSPCLGSAARPPIPEGRLVR